VSNFQDITRLKPLQYEIEGELDHKGMIDFELASLAHYESSGDRKVRKLTLKQLAIIAGLNSGVRGAREKIEQAILHPDRFRIHADRTREGIVGAAIIEREVTIVGNPTIGEPSGLSPLITGTFIEAWGRDLPYLYGIAAEEARLIDPNADVFTLEPTRDPDTPQRSGVRSLFDKKYNQDILHAIGQTMPIVHEVGLMQRTDMPGSTEPVHSQLFIG